MKKMQKGQSKHKNYIWSWLTYINLTMGIINIIAGFIKPEDYVVDRLLMFVGGLNIGTSVIFFIINNKNKKRNK